MGSDPSIDKNLRYVMTMAPSKFCQAPATTGDDQAAICAVNTPYRGHKTKTRDAAGDKFVYLGRYMQYGNIGACFYSVSANEKAGELLLSLKY